MTDWVEIAALIIGPVAAVGFTVWTERTRQTRERKFTVLRQLIHSRFDYTDPLYSMSVNLIPLEFGRSVAVMDAYDAFEKQYNTKDNSSENIRKALSKTLREMMIDLGFDSRAAGQVERGGYLSQAALERRNLIDQALISIQKLKGASEISARASVAIAEHVTGKPLEPIEE